MTGGRSDPHIVTAFDAGRMIGILRVACPKPQSSGAIRMRRFSGCKK